MTDKTLIDRGDKWECPECGGVWLKDFDISPRHGAGCPLGPVSEGMIKEIRTLDDHGAAIGAYDRIRVPMGQEIPCKPVPIYGWVCSRCQRVMAPHISECPHCQPGACGGSRIDGEEQ